MTAARRWRRTLVNAARLLTEALRFGAATRRIGLPVLLALGLVVVLLTVTLQFVAPVALYPFV